mmetsp:Transcript_23846/g.65921  ORF Transcript_23846/g.65921 Transcript_23846/m.65921 type:complete len:254 (+) Transcript_23846:1973-2734(+)
MPVRRPRCTGTGRGNSVEDPLGAVRPRDLMWSSEFCLQVGCVMRRVRDMLPRPPRSCSCACAASSSRWWHDDPSPKPLSSLWRRRWPQPSALLHRNTGVLTECDRRAAAGRTGGICSACKNSLSCCLSLYACCMRASSESACALSLLRCCCALRCWEIRRSLSSSSCMNSWHGASSSPELREQNSAFGSSPSNAEGHDTSFSRSSNESVLSASGSPHASWGTCCQFADSWPDQRQSGASSPDRRLPLSGRCPI